jgi:flagellar biosynthetic protein FlhB
MSESEDDASKTEDPSQKKLDDASKKGQSVQSREIGHFFMMLAFTVVIISLSSHIGKDSTDLLSPFITQPDQFALDASSIGITLKTLLTDALIIMILPMALAIVAVFAPNVVQQKFKFTTEQAKPKFEKISPLKGVKRIYSGKALIEFIKNTAKLIIVGIIVWYCSKPYLGYYDALSDQSAYNILELTKAIAGRIMIAICIMLFLVSAGDYLFQRFMFMKSMRMTKQEVKEEYKQQEGDPHIKGKLKQIRREKAKQRMMANVPNADVVVTNPTHFAVALQYNPETMNAPKVVAKGADIVAARIRELATKNKVPIVRNPPLARILYDTTDIDEVIPNEQYEAVAKIIGYVYRLKGKAPKPRSASTGKKDTPKGRKPSTRE